MPGRESKRPPPGKRGENTLMKKALWTLVFLMALLWAAAA